MKQRKSYWIPVTPCTIQEDVEIEAKSTEEVIIKAKGEFSFRDNPGCTVKITKWTGKDAVNHINIRPQVVSLTDCSYVTITVSNPDPERSIRLDKHDKIACMSVLSAPLPAVMISQLDCSPDRYKTAERGWVKVTTVVMRRKGEGSCST